MKFTRLLLSSAAVVVGLLVSGCVSSGYGPGPVYYGGYAGAYGGRYVYTPPRVVPAPRYRYRRTDYRPRPVYRQYPAYRQRPAYGSRPVYGRPYVYRPRPVRGPPRIY